MNKAQMIEKLLVHYDEGTFSVADLLDMSAEDIKKMPAWEYMMGIEHKHKDGRMVTEHVGLDGEITYKPNFNLEAMLREYNLKEYDDDDEECLYDNISERLEENGFE